MQKLEIKNIQIYLTSFWSTNTIYFHCACEFQYNYYLEWIASSFGIQLIICEPFADKSFSIVQRIGWIVICLRDGLVTNQHFAATGTDIETDI